MDISALMIFGLIMLGLMISWVLREVTHIGDNLHNFKNEWEKEHEKDLKRRGIEDD